MSAYRKLSDKERETLKDECTSNAWIIGAKKGIFALAVTATGDASDASPFEILISDIQALLYPPGLASGKRISVA